MEQVPSPQPTPAGPAAGPVGEPSAWVAPEAGAVLPRSGREIGRREDPDDRAPEASTRSLPPRFPAPLRPLTVSDILDGAFGVVKARPATVLSISAAIVLPVQVLGVLLLRETYVGGIGSTSVTDIFTAGVDTGAVAAQPGAALFLLLIVQYAAQNLSLFFLGGAIARLVSAWYAGGEVTPGQALAASFRRAHIHLAAWFPLFCLKAVCTVLAYCLIGLFALPFVVTVFSLTAIVIVVEGAGPFAAIARSWRLVMRRFFPVLLATMGATLATALASFAFSSLPAIVVGLTQLGEPFNWIVSGFFAIVGAIVIQPVLVAASVLVYLDLRMRTEGLDIELASADVFAPAA